MNDPSRRATSAKRRSKMNRKISRRWVQRATLLASSPILLLAFFSCGSTEPLPAQLPPNVIFILLDTLRADRVGANEHRSSLTPRIDAFAEGSVVFGNAYSHAPWTLPSVASIFTSQTPNQHGAGGRLGAFAVLQNQAVTLAEVLQEAGYATAAISNVLFLGHRFGAMQGFDTVDSLTPKNNQLTRIAEITTDTALGWLDRDSEQPFFLFVHYFDAHITYDPPEPYRSRHADPRDQSGSEHLFGTVKEVVAFRRGELDLPPETISRLEALYDAEVAYLDEHVGRLLEGIEDRGLLGDTVVVLTSDHGEEFLDHGGFEHGHTLFDELLKVPLAIRLPGEGRSADRDSGAKPAPSARRVESVVRLIDLAPTLIDLAGLDAISSFRGSSLLPHLVGEPMADRPVLSAGNMWGPSGRAWREGDFKLIEGAEDGRSLLFDVRADPREVRNLAPERAELVEQMNRTVGVVEEQGSGDSASPILADLTPEEREHLRALGYGQ